MTTLDLIDRERRIIREEAENIRTAETDMERKTAQHWLRYHTRTLDNLLKFVATH